MVGQLIYWNLKKNSDINSAWIYLFYTYFKANIRFFILSFHFPNSHNFQLFLLDICYLFSPENILIIKNFFPFNYPLGDEMMLYGKISRWSLLEVKRFYSFRYLDQWRPFFAGA